MELWEHLFEAFSAEVQPDKLRDLRNLSNYFGEEIPEEILSEFFAGSDRDFIFENLQSHNAKDLVRKISERFKIQRSRFPIRDGEKELLGLITLNPEEALKISKDPSFQDLIEFYGYNISSILGSVIQLEPEWPERVKFPGNGFHVVRPGQRSQEEIIKSIEKKGLMPRHSSDTRMYPRRLYVFCYPESLKDQEVLRRLRVDAQEINVGPEDWENVAVYKVLGSKRWKDYWYRDPAMKGPAYFTYNSIPPQYLKKIWPR